MAVKEAAGNGKDQQKFALRRSIIIGLGGTGRNICTHLKRILLETNDNNPRAFPHVKLLSIDTDNRIKPVETRAGDPVALDRSELMGLRIPTNLDKRKFGLFLTDDLMTQVLPFANDTGAARCRPIGHAFLVTNWRQIRDRLRTLYSELYAADLTDLVRTNPIFQGKNLDRERVDIYVTGNLVSGTGSGMALGMGYLLRDLTAELAADGTTHITTEGVFTTCGLFALADIAGQPSEYAVNCYASLLELGHFSSPAIYENDVTAFDPGFETIQLPREIRCRQPFDEVQLLNPSHSSAGGLRNEQFEPQIAAMLALRTGSYVGMTASAKLLDERANRPPFDQWGNQRFCRAWGAMTFRSAGQDIFDLAVGLAVDEVLDALTGENVRSAMNRKDVAYEVLTSFGFGHATDGGEPAKGNPVLFTSLLTPAEEVEGGAKNVSVIDSIKEMVTRAFPRPTGDKESIRGLPTLIDTRKGALANKVKGLVAAVVGHNRRAVALRIRDAVLRRIEEIADFTVAGRGSLDDAIGIIDLLVGTEGELESGLLRRDNTLFQANAQHALAEATKGRTLSQAGEQSVRTIADRVGHFEREALQGAWDQFVNGLIAELSHTARQAVFAEAQRILEGDATDREDLLRSGLIRELEKLRLGLKNARQQLKNLDVLFERRIERLMRSLRTYDQSGEGSIERARQLKCEVLMDENLRLMAELAVNRVLGRPHSAAGRYDNPDRLQQDYTELDRLFRDRVQAIGADRLAASIEDDPDFGGKLIGYLERAEPAIKLDVNLDSAPQIAYVSIPAGVPRFRALLSDLDWIEDRKGNKDKSELIEERPNDADPRIDVIAASFTFSPAAVSGISEWGKRYERVAASPAGRRRVHAVPDSQGGKNLIFEPLAMTSSRFELAYVIARSMGWLEPEGRGTAYLWKRHDAELLDETERRLLARGLEDRAFFQDFQRPLIEGSNDPEATKPIFLHALQRFRDLMTDEERESERAEAFAKLVIGMAQIVKRVGELGNSPLLPRTGANQDFRPFEHALRCLLVPLGLYESLTTRLRSMTAQQVPRLGEVHLLPGAPPKPTVEAPPVPSPHAGPAPVTPRCSNGHEVAVGARFCSECGTKLGEAAACSQCGNPAAAGQRFCPECGHPQQS